jgi:ubiquitin-conjugating enzyme E2 R
LKITRALLTDLQLIDENIFEWSVALIPLSPDSLYYGGYFKARISFPKNYPYSPPGRQPLSSLLDELC